MREDRVGFQTPPEDIARAPPMEFSRTQAPFGSFHFRRDSRARPIGLTSASEIQRQRIVSPSTRGHDPACGKLHENKPAGDAVQFLLPPRPRRQRPDVPDNRLSSPTRKTHSETAVRGSNQSETAPEPIGLLPRWVAERYRRRVHPRLPRRVSGQEVPSHSPRREGSLARKLPESGRPAHADRVIELWLFLPSGSNKDSLYSFS